MGSVTSDAPCPRWNLQRRTVSRRQRSSVRSPTLELAIDAVITSPLDETMNCTRT